MAPELRAGDVVIWDNLALHQARAAAVRHAQARLPPLPPYSPDSTPIEEMWSKVKAYLRRITTQTKGGVYDALGEAFRSVAATDILGWFQKAGLRDA